MIGNDLTDYTVNETQELLISQRILNGEKELFALLLKPHNKALYFAVRTMINNEGDAQKAMLSSYAAALKRLYCFYGQCSFKVWILSVAIRETNRLMPDACERLQNDDGVNTESPLVTSLIFLLHKVVRLSKKEISDCLQIPLKEIRQRLTLLAKQKEAGQAFTYKHDFLVDEFMNGLMTDPESVYTPGGDLKCASPLKTDTRVEAMQQLRQEHSENLALCTNIRLGFLKGIEMGRIKKYTDWYWNTHLMAHFSSEERVIFPILGSANPLVKKAVAEHKRLSRLFQSKQEIHKMLNRIEEELAAHIRFEEKILFKEIEQYAGSKGVETIESLHRGQEEPAWGDQFWK